MDKGEGAPSSEIGGTAPSGQAYSDVDTPTAKQEVIRKASGGSVQGDPALPRRLSKLFFPQNEDEEGVEDRANESTRLLDGGAEKVPVIVPLATLPKSVTVPHRGAKEREKKSKADDTETEPISGLDKIEDDRENSDFEESENATSVSEAQSSEEESEGTPERDQDYTSWDDTICSNRSAYFKHYYQKNLAALSSARSGDGGGGTSHNSLVSLIREKNKMAQDKSPEEKRKKKREDISLTVLVVFLFLVLTIGISLIYHFYNLHLEELSLFKRLKFYEDRRLLHLIDKTGNMDIQARLGTHLPMYAKPEDCTHYLQYFYKHKNSQPTDYDVLPVIGNKSTVEVVNVRKRKTDEFEFDDETVCLDWANQARVQIHKAATPFEINCYNVFWSAHSPGMSLQDCVLISSPSNGVWWGIGEISGGGFPLESISELKEVPYCTGELSRRPFGRILRRTFLSSFGGLVILPDHLPARLSINRDELCISVDPRDSIDPSMRLTLNYTLCSLPNVSSTVNYLNYLARGSKHFLPMEPKRENRVRTGILERINQPIWIPYHQPNESRLNQQSVLNYVEDILGQGENQTSSALNRGLILLPVSWQRKTENLVFDSDLFPDPKGMVKALREKGFNLVLTISPLVSTDTKAFKNGTVEGFWVQQKNSSLPALMQHDKITAGALTDFTNTRASKWFTSSLEKLKLEFGIDRFHLDAPDTFSIPRYHEFDMQISNPDLALKLFLKAVATVSSPLSTESVISPPRLPTFVSVGSEESGWKSLSSLIPRILTLTMLGYPLVDAGVIGGKPNRAGNVPDARLYVRWFQAATFLPAFQMNVLPSVYDERTRAIIWDFMEKRETMVLPRLYPAVEGALVNNTPLIFPLGMLYPEDLNATAVGDEWILGDDLLIAPILTEDATSRDIYIPEGHWESLLDGKLKPGPGWIHQYKVPLSNIALFLKKYTIEN